MANKTLTDFVKEALERGQARDSIEDALQNAGWPQDEIRDALTVYADVEFPVAVPKPRPYRPAQIAFFYVLFFILLGVVSFSVGNIIFALIENQFPYPDGQSDWRMRNNESQIRGGISGLIVGAPLFFYLGRYLGKKRRANPELKRSQIRKWLTYLTLIVAGATVLGDSISLVYSLLDGDMTMRFFLKSLTVGLIAGGIFLYFIKDAERDDQGAAT